MTYNANDLHFTKRAVTELINVAYNMLMRDIWREHISRETVIMIRSVDMQGIKFELLNNMTGSITETKFLSWEEINAFK